MTLRPISQCPTRRALESHGRYLALVAAIQADVERSGKRVVRVRMPVSAMIAELEKHGWPNDTKHRAKVIGERGAIGGES